MKPGPHACQSAKRARAGGSDEASLGNEEGRSGALRQATLAFGQGPPARRPPTSTSTARNGRPAALLRPPPGRCDLSPGAHVLYLPSHFSPGASASLFTALQAEVHWLQRDVTVWGRTVPQRRLVAYQADRGARPYTYSGLTLAPAGWSPAVASIRAAVEAAAGGARFDTCLLNLYRDGTDCMGWHADNEALYGGADAPKTIASASFGAGRAFQLRPTPGGRADGRAKLEFELGGGDLLLMCGTTQRDWQHAVPARAKVGGVRINLTFRKTADGG